MESSSMGEFGIAHGRCRQPGDSAAGTDRDDGDADHHPGYLTGTTV
jgi:hypothetical protein